MAEETPVDRLFSEAAAIIAALGDNEPSLAVAAGDTLRKALLLGAASYLEMRVSRSVLEFVAERAAGDECVVSFVRNKAVLRQYHTWFKWDESNANQFFGLFGSDFKAGMADRVKNSDELRASIAAFLEVGNERNKMIHQDFASFSLEKTLDEIYDLYHRALRFVDGLGGHLRGVDVG